MMKHYLPKAIRGLAIGIGLCIMFDVFIRPETDWSSWSWFGRLFGILAWVYFAFAPQLLVDLFQSKRCWADERTRSIAIPAIGAFWGLICLNFVAWGYSAGESLKYIESPLRFGSPAITKLAGSLFVKLDVLFQMQYFVNHAIQVSAGTALLTIIGFWLYDKHKPGWATTTFSTLMLLPVPFLALLLAGSHLIDGRIGIVLFLYLMPWFMFSLLVTGIVWTYRTGLLTCDITEVPARWKQWSRSN